MVGGFLIYMTHIMFPQTNHLAISNRRRLDTMSKTPNLTRLRRSICAALFAATFTFAVAASDDANAEGGVQTPGAHVPAALSGYIIAVG